MLYSRDAYFVYILVLLSDDLYKSTFRLTEALVELLYLCLQLVELLLDSSHSLQRQVHRVL